MKSNILTVMKKEFTRFFSDRRMVFTTLILPGLIIYLMYSFMGGALTDMVHMGKDKPLTAYTVNMPDSLSAVMAQGKFELKEIKQEEAEKIKEEIKEKDQNLLMIFPEHFDAEVEAYDVKTASGRPAPNVEMFYNSASIDSLGTYEAAEGILEAYEHTLSNKFDVNFSETEQSPYDLATKEDSTGQIFSMLMPMLMMIFLFSGCMAVAPESIAGEKERGTMATILVTPIKRSELAIGKICSLGVIALLSGISSFLGTALSLPNLMGGAGDELNASVYSVIDYVFLGLIILSTVLLIVSLISIISAFAKTVKEASTAVMPLMLIVMLLGVSSMFAEGSTDLVYYFIPLYNSVLCMNGIFSFSYIPTEIFITFGSNLVYAVICVVALAKMFNSEKIVYSN